MRRWMTVMAVWCLSAGLVSAEDLGQGFAEGWGGQWKWVRDGRPMLKQTEPGAGGYMPYVRDYVKNSEIRGGQGVWRCVVLPGPDVKEAGMHLAVHGIASSHTKDLGLYFLLGGTGQSRGVLLSDAAGNILWKDEYAPWSCYVPRMLEVVIEKDRLYAQMLDFEGKTLLSQSDWIPIDPQEFNLNGFLALETRSGTAGFWGFEVADKPMAAMTDNAPNKLRLNQDPDSPWLITGGLWQWTDGRRLKIRQGANDPRNWAYSRQVAGQDRTWRCGLEVKAPAGGAGMVFQSGGPSQPGLLAWLGGQANNGCLMLYKAYGDNQFEAIWGGPSGIWHYDTPYLMEAETREGKARIRLLSADGQTVLSESPWVDYPEAIAAQPGMIGFHTWRGPAEFWGFSDESGPAVAVKAAVDELGKGWFGPNVQWQLTGEGTLKLQHVGENTGQAINREIEGIHGQWQCRVVPESGSEATLLFQISADGGDGFAATIKVRDDQLLPTFKDVREDRILWSGQAMKYKPGSPLILAGRTALDRVMMRLYQPGEDKPVADSDWIYIPTRHNKRVGHLGVQAQGQVHFSDWGYRAEQD